MVRRTLLAVSALAACLAMAAGTARGAAAAAPFGPDAAGPALPQPQATVVYKSDFSQGGGLQWWPRWTDKTPAGNRAFLGQFGVEPATLTLRNLAPHKFLRIKMSLFMLEPMDGSSPAFGVCPWEMQVLGGGPRLIYATFDNCCFFSNNNEQSFPDDFPWAVHKGWSGAAEKQTLGYVRPFNSGALPEDCSSVYDMTLVFPNEDKDLQLLLRGVWGKSQKKWGASWGLENMTVEILDGPVPLSDKDLEDLWSDLAGQNAAQAFAATWKLTGAGQQAVDFIGSKIGKPVRPREKPPEAKPEDEVDLLLKQLDDPSYPVRVAASKRLVEVGRPVLSRLQTLAESADSPEVRMRLREIVRKLQDQPPSAAAAPEKKPQELLGPRAAKVLEVIGGVQSLALVDRIARSEDPKLAPFAWASRQRLAERMIDELLARADAAGRADDLKNAEALCDQALALAKASLPEEAVRIGATRDDCRLRAKARTAALHVVGDAARREAMRQRLAVADDPAGALTLADDPKDQAALRLAANPIEELTPDQVQMLRAFYLKETPSPNGGAVDLPSMVTRALAAARPGAEPTEKGFSPTDDIDISMLKAWSIDRAAHGRWAEILPLMTIPVIEKGNHIVPQNEWRRQWNGMKCGGNAPFLCLRVQPAGSYQLRLTALAVGSDVVVWVPVGEKHVAFIMDRSGKVVIEAEKVVPGPNPWLIDPQLDAGEYQVDVTVRQDAAGGAAVGLVVDGRDVAEWKGKVADLQKEPEFIPDEVRALIIEMKGADLKGTPAIKMQGDWGLVRAAALRMLDGKVKFDPVEQPLAPPPQPEVEVHIEIEELPGVP